MFFFLMWIGWEQRDERREAGLCGGVVFSGSPLIHELARLSLSLSLTPEDAKTSKTKPTTTTGVLKAINVNKLTKAGCTFKFW